MLHDISTSFIYYTINFLKYIELICLQNDKLKNKVVIFMTKLPFISIVFGTRPEIIKLALS